MNSEGDSSRILRRLQQGGQSELTAVFTDLRAHLRNMIQARIERRLLARVDASDIVQETFVRASKGLNAYLESPTVPPAVWLRLIGKRILAEVHRQNFRDKRSPARELRWDEEVDDLLVGRMADSMASVSSTVALNELTQLVRERIRSLPATDREILEIRHVDGLSLEESAKILEITRDAAKKRYYRALGRFRSLASDLIARIE